MPAPVINPTTSVLDYRQHEYWTFRPFATGEPDNWSIDPMAPPGMVFDTATGSITGACLVAGIYVFAVRASKTVGDAIAISDPLVLTVGIEASASDPRSLAVDVRIDLLFREVTLWGSVATQIPVKRGDDLIFNVRFVKGGVVTGIPLEKLSWSLKKTPDGDVLAASDEWKQLTFGAEATYAIHAKLDSAALSDELEASENQQFLGYGEFEWLQTNPDPNIGPDPLRGSSQSHRVLAVKDQFES